MAIKQGREYRALQDFSLVPRDEGSKEYRVRGTAIVFNSPTVLWECDGVEYKEIIDRHAFDECDMSDVIFNYNHGGKVVARLRNKTLALNIDERGVNIDADLGGTTAGRELYEEIDGGYVDKMSFSFTVREASYDSVTHTVVYVRLHENGCYVPCDEAEAGGFCIKTAIDRKDEETGETTTYLEDFVYAFADGGLLGIEPVGSVENVSGTLMLAENDKVLDILLGGAAE